jgi:hypothetical protein
VGGTEAFRNVETGSRRQQSRLEAISGPLKGEHLQLYPFLLTSRTPKPAAESLLLRRRQPRREMIVPVTTFEDLDAAGAGAHSVVECMGPEAAKGAHTFDGSF